MRLGGGDGMHVASETRLPNERANTNTAEYMMTGIGRRSGRKGFEGPGSRGPPTASPVYGRS
jgi:hypothetical protein